MPTWYGHSPEMCSLVLLYKIRFRGILLDEHSKEGQDPAPKVEVEVVPQRMCSGVGAKKGTVQYPWPRAKASDAPQVPCSQTQLS
jgi:hypothetical protein